MLAENGQGTWFFPSDVHYSGAKIIARSSGNPCTFTFTPEPVNRISEVNERHAGVHPVAARVGIHRIATYMVAKSCKMTWPFFFEGL